MKDSIINYIKSEFLQDGDQLSEETKLISDGYIDSISTLKLVDFLEKEFEIEFDGSEINAEHLDSVNQIIKLIQSKLKN